MSSDLSFGNFVYQIKYDMYHSYNCMLVVVLNEVVHCGLVALSAAVVCPCAYVTFFV